MQTIAYRIGELMRCYYTHQYQALPITLAQAMVRRDHNFKMISRQTKQLVNTRDTLATSQLLMAT